MQWDDTNLIYFENLFRDIGFSSSYCFVPVYLSVKMLPFPQHFRVDFRRNTKLSLLRTLTVNCQEHFL